MTHQRVDPERLLQREQLDAIRRRMANLPHPMWCRRALTELLATVDALLADNQRLRDRLKEIDLRYRLVHPCAGEDCTQENQCQRCEFVTYLRGLPPPRETRCGAPGPNDTTCHLTKGHAGDCETWFTIFTNTRLPGPGATHTTEGPGRTVPPLNTADDEPGS